MLGSRRGGASRADHRDRPGPGIRCAAASLGLIACAAATACDRGAGSRAAGLPELRTEVESLRLAAAARIRSDSLLRPLLADSTALIVGLHVGTVRALLTAAATRYLTDVKLHLRPDVRITETDEVRVGIGPLRVGAGHWDLAVTIERIDATLRADSIGLVVSDSSRIDIDLPVHVSGGSGDATIDFHWDAAVVASVVCGDFDVRERLSAYVEPRSYRIRGYFELVNEGEGLVARPVVRQRIPVSPQPTAASWARVREILNEQNHIFNCGLALSPSGMEAMLRDLLTRGFRFRLPQSILRPVPLPASIANEVDVAGRRVAIAVAPAPPRLTADWIWLRGEVDAIAIDAAPITVTR